MTDVTSRLRQAWCRETSSVPGLWTPENPALGQCAVTALIVQDIFGGELVRGHVHKASHYWNRIDGYNIDFTKEQFGRYYKDLVEDGVRTREYLLSNANTYERYYTLRYRLGLHNWPWGGLPSL